MKDFDVGPEMVWKTRKMLYLCNEFSLKPLEKGQRNIEHFLERGSALLLY